MTARLSKTMKEALATIERHSARCGSYYGALESNLGVAERTLRALSRRGLILRFATTWEARMVRVRG